MAIFFTQVCMLVYINIPKIMKTFATFSNKRQVLKSDHMSQFETVLFTPYPGIIPNNAHVSTWFPAWTVNVVITLPEY